MMQSCRRLGLVLESLKLLGIKRGSEGQHFQGDAAAERDLLRFVDDSHATVADFAVDAEIAEGSPGRPVIMSGEIAARGNANHAGQDLHRGQNQEQSLRLRGMLFGEFFHVDALTGL